MEMLRLENEEVAATFSKSEPGFCPVDAAEVLHRHIDDVSGLVVDGRLRLWPHRHATDGFFAAIWQRRT
jgi:16S rRNA (cytosine967-C5)-methyltransferase